MDLIHRVQLVRPENEITVSRDDSGVFCVNDRSCRNLVFLRFADFVGYIHPRDVNVMVGGVVKLDPVVFLEIFVYGNRVRRAYLVNHHKLYALLLQFFSLHWGEISLYIKFPAVWERQFLRFRQERVVGFVSLHPCERRIPIDVGRSGTVVMHLYSDGVHAAFEERNRYVYRSAVGVSRRISCGVRIERNVSAWHKIACRPYTVDIKDKPVVAGEVKFEDVFLRRFSRQVYGIREIICRVFVAFVVSIVEDGVKPAVG